MGASISLEDVTLDATQFEFLRKLIRERAGICLAEAKKPLVRTRLLRRMKALGLRSMDDYIYVLKSDDADEAREFVNSLTTNLTSFFREGHHFQTLLEIANEAIENRQPLSIWSSACSTGEEPYSIAMLLAKHGLAPRLRQLKILATDIDTRVLAAAESGVYENQKVDGIRDEYDDLLMQGVGDNAGNVRISRDARDLISFKQLNLMQPWPIRIQFDVIFCRNVLIYFDKDTQEKLVDRLVNQLRPGGTLFLGHSESARGNHPLLTSHGKTTFRRKENS